MKCCIIVRGSDAPELAENIHPLLRHGVEIEGSDVTKAALNARRWRL